jgi:heat shock protein HtpX
MVITLQYRSRRRCRPVKKWGEEGGMSMNTSKTGALMVLLTMTFLALGAFLGGRSGMTMALVIALGMNLVTYWFSDKIVLKMYGAREVTEHEAARLYQTVARLSQNASLPMPRIYLIDQHQPNAFATGRNPEHGAIAITTGLLQTLTSEELEGVIAHELAHIRNRDILIGTVAATIAGAVTYLDQMAQWAMIFGGRGNDEKEGGGGIASELVMMIVGPIAALLIQMAISRSREYIADADGARFSGNPLKLAGALKKLQVASRKLPMEATPATAHMFIVNPLSGGSLFRLFSTHPPMEKRIKRLEEMVYGS